MSKLYEKSFDEYYWKTNYLFIIINIWCRVLGLLIFFKLTIVCPLNHDIMQNLSLILTVVWMKVLSQDTGSSINSEKRCCKVRKCLYNWLQDIERIFHKKLHFPFSQGLSQLLFLHLILYIIYLIIKKLKST